MPNLLNYMIKEAIGFIFIGVGIILSILEKILCKSLCSVCTNQQLSPCFFLFIFVGIILIADGTSLILLGQTKESKNKNKGRKKR